MSRGRQLIVILAAVLVLGSVLSHAVARLLGISSDRIERRQINADAPGTPILVMGSSLTFFGISFREIAKELPRPFVTRSVGGASPCELEPLALEVPEPARLIIGVSIFDLNESNLSDSRPSLVPFSRTVSDLRESGADWPFTKRVLWSYPLPWLQQLFPVAGRSTGVMVNLRDKARSVRHRQPAAEPETRLTFKTDDDYGRPEKLSDWDAGRVARNVSQLTGAGFANGRFDGPKALSLARILKRAAGREPTLVLVFPVSPPYRQAFAGKTSVARFEEALDRAKAADPQLRMIRLDHEPALRNAEVFWDLVHLNDDGRRFATRLVSAELSAPPAR